MRARYTARAVRRGGLAALILLLGVGRLIAGEPPYIYGIHDHDPQPTEYINHIRNAVPGGWVTATVAIGHDQYDNSGVDFTWYANHNMTVICRLNNGYFPNGTIPLKENYADFAKRCANFVRHSPGCNMWIIGNELNIWGEWPARDKHLAYVEPVDYADCYRQCYNAIKAVDPSNKVLSAPCAPFSGPFIMGREGEYTHDGCILGWTDYEYNMLYSIMATGPIDGIALHVYSRGFGYNDIYSTAKTWSNGRLMYMSFFCYKDWIDYGIPIELYSLPAYITECDGYFYWKGGHPEDSSRHYLAGWMQEVYKEIDNYNRTVAFPGKKPVIRCVNMYRWCAYYDGWNIDGSDNPYKGQMLSDLDSALALQYSWPGSQLTPYAWSDDFNDGSLDGNAPEPEWISSAETGGSVEESGGYLKLKGTAGSASRALINDGVNRVYKDFVIDAKVLLADSRATTGPSGTAEIRFRADNTGAGYALSFKGGDSPSTISLRRTDTGEVIQGKEITRDLPSGTVLYATITLNGQNLSIQVGTSAGAGDAADWTVTDTTFANQGCFWLVNNGLMDVEFDYFNYRPFLPGIQGVVKDTLGNVIPGATVQTDVGGYSTTTNGDGTYSLPNMGFGTYAVTASKTNYSSQKVGSILLSAGTVTVNLTIKDNTRPSVPVVTVAGPYQTSSTSVTFSWSSSDPESGILDYRDAVSRSPSEIDVVSGGGFVFTSATSITRTGLSLNNGQTYYALAKARNPINLMSLTGASSGFKIAKAVDCVAAAKAEPDGRMVALQGRIVTASFPECIYVSDPDRTSGIKVMATGIAEGTLVDFAGFLSTVNGERQISGYAITPGEAGHDLRTFLISNRRLYGESLNQYTPGVTQGFGMHNTGLLFTTWGKVMESGAGYFIVRDGAPKMLMMKVIVPNGVDPPQVGQFVVATGINTVEAGTLLPALRVRGDADIQVY